jgi:hypothetical protein
MAETLKVLGQSNPAASTLTACYTVPALTTATVSSLVVCNQASSQGTFRVSIAVAGAADNAKQYVYRDLTISSKNTFIATVGFTLGPADVVRVYASNASMSFQLFGVEVA